LSHVFERFIVEMGSLQSGFELFFADKLDTFVEDLNRARPTLFMSIPRIWTKFQQAILSKMPQKKLDLLLKVPVLSGIIKNKIKTGLGLNECEVAISGAAPMSAALIDWFAKLDINIQEVYGATELCGGVTFNALEDVAPGTVGRALPGAHVKIDPESDEVLIKAPWVMRGYYQSPEKTAEVLQDGYYYTGDTGRFDQDGRLIITGRIKDTFKTAKGKFILPVPIENKLGRNVLVEQVVVTGMGLVQPFALICLSENTAAMTRDELAANLGSTLDELNGELESYARLSHFVVFREPWAEDSGFFTPTLKIKRHIIDAHFKANYDDWTTSKIRIVWAQH